MNTFNLTLGKLSLCNFFIRIRITFIVINQLYININININVSPNVNYICFFSQQLSIQIRFQLSHPCVHTDAETRAFRY